MERDNVAIARLIAKEEIRELVLLYARAADRRDTELMRSLYTKDGIDNHGEIFSGNAGEFVDFMAANKGRMGYTGHFVCNHLIAVESDEVAYGEVYLIAYHHMLADADEVIEDIMLVRYHDHYRKEDGLWRFARRDTAFDQRFERPLPKPTRIFSEEDPSYDVLHHPIFGKGARGVRTGR